MNRLKIRLKNQATKQRNSDNPQWKEQKLAEVLTVKDMICNSQQTWPGRLSGVLGSTPTGYRVFFRTWTRSRVPESKIWEKYGRRSTVTFHFPP